ncbi:hypothetical protein Tco_0594974, partial [Tanacetum coccineum]
DIIFRFTNESLSTEFEQLMHKRFQTFWRIHFLGDKHVSWSSKKQELHCNVFSRGKYGGVISSLLKVIVDETTLQDIWLQQTTKYRCIATLSQP